MKYAIYEGAGGRRFVGNTKQGPLVARASRDSGCAINSNARNAKAAPLLHSIQLHTQAEVIVLHAQGVPGFGPANPVNRTTHCGRNDGVAYRRRPPGFRLPWWAWGIDVNPVADNVRRFCEEMRKHNVSCTPTYPGSVGESQHVNIRKLPRWFLTLKQGDTSVRVRVISKWLKEIGDYHGPVTRHFTPELKHALQVFQSHHHLAQDGVYGPHTAHALHVRINKLRRDRKEAHK